MSEWVHYEIKPLSKKPLPIGTQVPGHGIILGWQRFREGDGERVVYRVVKNDQQQVMSEDAVLAAIRLSSP